MKRVLFAASECVPFIKTGGLADVCGALPKEFDKSEWDVRVVIPNYSCIPESFRNEFRYVTHFYMSTGSYIRDKYVGVLQYELDGIKYYFIDNQEYFDSFLPYGNVRYDIEKFCFFVKAVLSMLKQIDFCPDIIHCHDWQTGLIPVYLHERFAGGEFYRGIKTVMTIHNLKFQGVWDVKTIQRFTELPDYYFTPDKLEAYKDGNLLKGGIVYADAITTVSNTYAEEIKTPFYGEGLDGLMAARSNDLCGIVNGLDYNDWNPDTDHRIAKTFNVENFRKNKPVNKAALQEELGLDKDNHVMLIGIVSRLTDQKGFDLIDYMMNEMCQDAVQIAVLGTGDPKYENMFRHFAWKYAGKVSANIFYSDDLSHRLYAGCDAFLMPSLFEPCGLSQLMSMRYGTVPMVRETGGLRDTVCPYNEYEQTGNGFSFANYNAHEMLHMIRYAKDTYVNHRNEWNGIVKRAMDCDYSWNASAKDYESLYEELFKM